MKLEAGYVKIIVDTIVAGIMPFGFRRDIQAEVEFNGIAHDPKQAFEVLVSAKWGGKRVKKG